MGGRMQTSSVNLARVDDIEYAFEDSHGRHVLDAFHGELSTRYGIQNAFAVARDSGSHRIVVQFECVLVGTVSNFRADGRNCFAWKPGESRPPKLARHFPVSGYRNKN